GTSRCSARQEREVIRGVTEQPVLGTERGTRTSGTRQTLIANERRQAASGPLRVHLIQPIPARRATRSRVRADDLSFHGGNRRVETRGPSGGHYRLNGLRSIPGGRRNRGLLVAGVLVGRL